MELRISSPCPVSWDSLTGNDRVRYCGRCQLNVYNLAGMKPAEVEGLVRSAQGRLCGRLYVREDGRAMLRDCGVARGRRLARRAWTVASLLLLGAFGWVIRAVDSDRSVHPTWVRAVLEWVDPQPTPKLWLKMGDIPTPPPPPAARR